MKVTIENFTLQEENFIFRHLSVIHTLEAEPKFREYKTAVPKTEALESSIYVSNGPPILFMDS